MENWKVELAAGGQSLAEIKIGSHGDSLSPQQYVIAMIPLNFVLGICLGGYKFTKSPEKINHRFIWIILGYLPKVKRNKNPNKNYNILLGMQE